MLLYSGLVQHLIMPLVRQPDAIVLFMKNKQKKELLMRYRVFGKDNWNISALGFGAMRLPTTPDGKRVDIESSVALIRRGIDLGINYIDTAYFYHDGTSEGIVAKALEHGYRKKVRIATKSPGHLIETADDFDRILDEQLTRLRTDTIEYYLFHGIGDAGMGQIKRLGLFSRMEKAKADGRVGHIGFSFHDGFDAFRRIIDGYDVWEFCQIQYNYMDIYNQAGTAGLRYAAARNIPVIVMEPLLGGRLARPPKEALRHFETYPVKKSPAAWSLQWIWNHPEVATILSGMNSTTQLEENCALADTTLPGSMSSGELDLIAAVRNDLNTRTIIPCTGCRYCMPCPAGLDIPWNISLFNDGYMYDAPGAPRFAYSTFMKPQQRAAACTGCKACESRCPQHIAISERMPEIHAVLGENRGYGT
jgi:predicted aldo/keto reductase-like oxidoreductase